VHDLAHHVAPRLLPYAMSFLTLGIFWVGQQTQLSSFTRSTRALTWIHLAFLLAVTLIAVLDRAAGAGHHLQTVDGRLLGAGL
jgi:uncharacterized membrane protein